MQWKNKQMPLDSTAPTPPRRPDEPTLRASLDSHLPAPMSDDQWTFAQRALCDMVLADKELIDAILRSAK